MIAPESKYSKHNPEQTERTVADMTIRELYAGLAMVARGSKTYNKWNDLADDCFDIADAMIRRSEQPCNRQVQ